MKLKWTDELTKRAKECCAGASSVPAAYRKWKRLTGADVTLAAFRQKMDNESPLGSASGMLKTAGSKGVTDAHALYIRIRKEPLSVDDAADSLEWCPRRVRAAYDSARAIGLAMQLVNGQLMFVRAVDEEAKRLDLGDAEATDGAINGISDLHIGSNYFMHDALADHVAYGVKNGAKLTTISGDLSEGDYPHAAYERTANGCEAQVKLILDPRRGLPYHEGHRYVVISGNHDETFEGRSGISFGRVLIDRAKAQGRHDIVWAGSRGALLAYRGLLIYLHHPKRGPSYALSYQLQTWVRDRDGDQPRPNILLCGHHHRSAMVRAGKTYCFHAGTFQHGDSAFGRSLGGSVAVGGWLLRWERDKRRISRMIAEWRPVLGPPPFAIPVSSEVTP